MKKLFLLILISISAAKVFAGDVFLDSERLRDCNGTISLYKAYNDDLSIELKGVNTRRCDQLRVYDVSSGRTIKNYRIQGTSYTLSKSQVYSLNQDCRLGIELYDSTDKRHTNDKVQIVLRGWRCGISAPHNPQSPHHSKNKRSYQWSNNQNCKLLVNNNYVKNVSDQFCTPAGHSKSIVTYEYSHQNNCKIMIDGNYFKNTSEYYCDSRP